MDSYLGYYLTQTYPELNEDEWKRTPDSTRVEIYLQLNHREMAWVQIHLKNRPDIAKDLWMKRGCEEPSHHPCPGCGLEPEFQGVGMEFVCLNNECSYLDFRVDAELRYPWIGFNHIRPSDIDCGPERWDTWDN